MLAALSLSAGFASPLRGAAPQSQCPDADYYSFGDGYVWAFKSAPEGAPDQLVKEWRQHDTAPGGANLRLTIWQNALASSSTFTSSVSANWLRFAVNVGTPGQPVFAVLSENRHRLYRFAPCEADPFGEQPQGMDLIKPTGGMLQPVWGHYDAEEKLLYVAMFGGSNPFNGGLAVLNIASPAAADWSFQSSTRCTKCAHVHSVWKFAADEILIADVGVPWAKEGSPGKEGKGVFRFSSGAFQQVSEAMNARVLAADPDGSHLYVVTQEDMTAASQTRVFQLQRSNADFTTVAIAKLEPHDAWMEGGAMVESLGEPGKVLVTDRSGSGGAGYLVDFGKAGSVPQVTKLGAPLSGDNPRYSVLLHRADGKMPPYTVLTAEHVDAARPCWKTDFTTAADAKSTAASVGTPGLAPASHIVQVR